MKQNKDDARKKLEQLGAEWAALGPEDTGRRLALQGSIFTLVYELFPGYEDEITTIFLNDWEHFDPAKGSAYGFFGGRIKWRRKDAGRGEKRIAKHTQPDTIEREDGSLESLTEALPTGPDSSPENVLELDDTACTLLNCVMDLHSRLQGRANNPTRRNYFRMFFTDTAAFLLHTDMPLPCFTKRERDIFSTIKQEFLNFFMQEECRCLAEVRRSPLKPYGALVEGRKMEETVLPLPDDVFISYLDRMEHAKAGPSAISQQRQAYREFVRSFLS